MEFPKLNPRPEAKMVCTAFRGLDRRPGASNKSYNKSWNWGWHDERNLSSDRWPRLAVRKNREAPATIDGNTPDGKIIAMCGGDHIVLLDETGVFYCNGHTLNANMPGDVLGLRWNIKADTNSALGDVHVTITPKTGFDLTYAALNYLGLTLVGGTYTVTQREVQFKCTDDDGQGNQTWVCDIGTPGDFQTSAAPSDYNITVTGDNLLDGVVIKVTQWNGITSLLSERNLLRMGTMVIDQKTNYWIDAVKLAAGQAMTEGTDYGNLGLESGPIPYQTLGPIVLKLCDIDGNAYSGVVVSATEPTQDGYWLDTSGAKPVLQEWSVSQSMWVSITSTYVRVHLTTSSWNDGVRVGDTIKIETDVPTSTDENVKELLNSWHYIYSDITENSVRDLVISGILPSDSVTVTADLDNHNMYVSRPIPQMDFVVEAQNRLWGCRYSEADNLNEVYASKLGDPRNWHVFQGLSTDSWTASRGTAAPYTGAITLGGNPLFFREESLEKVFPSSTGAHQIATYSLEGVQKGSHNSMVVIDERLYYKSRLGVCVYAGTLPSRISEEFNDWQFSSATAARHKDKYVVCMTSSDGQHLCLVLDLDSGDWHVENETWDGIAVTWADVLYYVKDGVIYQMDGQDSSTGIAWYAESDDMSLELPEHKWVTYLRLRFQLELGAACRVYIKYDDGEWERKASLTGNHLRTLETAIWPRRCDHFRLRLEGTGGCELQSISYRVERSQGGR